MPQVEAVVAPADQGEPPVPEQPGHPGMRGDVTYMHEHDGGRHGERKSRPAIEGRVRAGSSTTMTTTTASASAPATPAGGHGQRVGRDRDAQGEGRADEHLREPWLWGRSRRRSHPATENPCKALPPPAVQPSSHFQAGRRGGAR